MLGGGYDFPRQNAGTIKTVIMLMRPLFVAIRSGGHHDRRNLKELEHVQELRSRPDPSDHRQQLTADTTWVSAEQGRCAMYQIKRDFTSLPTYGNTFNIILMSNEPPY